MQRTIDDMINQSTEKASQQNDTNGNFFNAPSKNKTTTIAMKLKMAQCPTTSQSSAPQKLPSPKVTPPKDPIEYDMKIDSHGSILDPNFKTRSLMVDMIPRGLSLATVRDYFNKYGKITNVTDPPRNSKSASTKFVFIKFEKYESVEKALGEWQSEFYSTLTIEWFFIVFFFMF